MSHWVELFGVEPSLASVIAVIAFHLFAVILPAAYLFSFFESKTTADLQARIGFSQVGLRGFFQGLADFFKLLQKEKKTRVLGSLWFWLLFLVLYSSIALLPMGSLTLLIDTDLSAFFPLLIGVILSLGTLWVGLSQGIVVGWIGGLKIAAQSIVSCFPAMIALICVGLEAGGYRWSEIVGSQGWHPFSWVLFSNFPFQGMAFFSFFVSGLLLFGIPPFDTGGSSEVFRGGIYRGLEGRQYGVFLFNRFYGLFLWSFVTVALFCGGWNIPESWSEALLGNQSYRTLALIELTTVLIKGFALMLAVVLFRRINPRLNTEMVTQFCVRFLSPLSILALLGVLTSIWVAA